MKRQMRTALYSSVALAAMAASVPVIAQEITSTIKGSITDVNGAPLSGVTVTLTHVPSGSVTTYTSNNSGAFVARGLRPGGPYDLSIAGTSSYQGTSLKGIQLNVGEPLPLNIPLAASDASLEEIQVVAGRIATIRGGGASAYSADSIEEMASISRDLKDTLRINPFVSIDASNSDALSIGGANNRFNSLTVDGVRQDDDFGLNGSGYPTQRSPISIDAVEQVSVSPAPFDVEFGKFTGGQINVVTKSGTNEFHGTAFYTYRNDSMVGDKSVDAYGNDKDVDLGDFSQKVYGGTLGGPIIKDKLFFFASYEKYEGSTPNTYGAEDSGATNGIPGVTTAELERIDQIASGYGIDTMYGDTGGIPEEDEKLLLKVDWNINDQHRAFVSYQYTNGNSLSQTDIGGTYYSYKSHWYNRSEKLRTINAQLYSDWTDSFSTELKFGYKKNITGQVGLSADSGVGEIRIYEGSNRIYLGVDDSRHANALNNETWQAKLKAQYVTGDHIFTAGYEYDSVDVFNMYVQGSLGVWSFDSIDDFEAGTPSSFSYANAGSNNPRDAAAAFKLTTHTGYVQDRWDVNDKLTVTAGVRVDLWKTNDAPTNNPNFEERNGFANTATVDGKYLIQPRFAFTYALDDKTTVRGGAGRFGGGSPLVWMSNNYSNDGVTLLNYYATSSDADLTDPDFTNVYQFAQDGLNAASASANVNALDPDFKMPSTWKMNLAVERYVDLGALGDDWHLGLEAIWARPQNSLTWKELRREEIGTAADGSPIYSTESGYDILLTNGRDGKQDTYAFSFDKSWENGLTVYGSYTYMDATAANEGSSSTATSSYNYTPHLDRNDILVGTSRYEVKNQVKLGLTYKKDIWDDNTTTINLFYSGRSGRPYSITMNQSGTPFGGSGSIDTGDYHLLYVPTASEAAVAGTSAADSAKVVFSSAEVMADFNELVDSFGLKRGQSVDLNSERSPWINDLDLKISQEVPVGFGKVELFMNLENVLNFLNHAWGADNDSQYTDQNLVRTAVDNNPNSAQFGQITYTDVSTTPYYRFNDDSSVWVLQIGAKYKF